MTVNGTKPEEEESLSLQRMRRCFGKNDHQARQSKADEQRMT